MSLYTSLDDVKLILGEEGSAHDSRITRCIDAVEAWAGRKLWIPPAEGSQATMKFYDVAEDASLEVPLGVEVNTVKVFPYRDADTDLPFESIVGQGWEHDRDRRRVYLRPNMTVAPIENARATRFLRTFDRVEVTYTGENASLPVDFVEGIGFLAAGYYQDGPRALSGLSMEKIGDYQYQLGRSGGEDDDSFIQRAYFFLGDYFKRNRVEVI